MAYATVADLEARWRDLSPEEEAVAATLLDDAAMLLDSMVEVDEWDVARKRLLCTVSCSMVKRAMASSTNDAFGVTQGSISADVYSQSLTFANPSGDLYVTASEKRALGVGRGFIGSIPARVGGRCCKC